ncbi:hypothetical protein H257_15258 [Aphanomyces astaci]|uniref:Uncharacterized protein n=1 Tax=Aphanomyces astaci TaxID=112090 RepID=W4FQF6_APHAT|nr:hypothetical protein H257_15258 [Aphanomyces astaci]ETV68913.1 hypothetical protein H257_15258 [Aphanomyces astaci]|eukprot:XP_009841590.1 hypothetical protein H257_15258 [Aphanomyces astaci]
MLDVPRSGHAVTVGSTHKIQYHRIASTTLYREALGSGDPLRHPCNQYAVVASCACFPASPTTCLHRERWRCRAVAAPGRRRRRTMVRHPPHLSFLFKLTHEPSQVADLLLLLLP